jgi:hypothetical protein
MIEEAASFISGLGKPDKYLSLTHTRTRKREREREREIERERDCEEGITGVPIGRGEKLCTGSRKDTHQLLEGSKWLPQLEDNLDI